MAFCNFYINIYKHWVHMLITFYLLYYLFTQCTHWCRHSYPLLKEWRIYSFVRRHRRILCWREYYCRRVDMWNLVTLTLPSYKSSYLWTMVPILLVISYNTLSSYICERYLNCDVGSVGCCVTFYYLMSINYVILSLQQFKIVKKNKRMPLIRIYVDIDN